MCHDLPPAIGRSEMSYHDLKGLQMELFFLFLDLIPVLNRLQVAEYGSKGPKIGKRVMCRDFRPINDRPVVMSHHHEPVEDGLKVTGACFRCDVLNDSFSCLAFSMRRAGLCRAETSYAETAVPFQINQLLNFKLLKL